MTIPVLRCDCRSCDFDFYTETAAGTSNRFMRLGWPGTDGYLARKFAADKGYTMPDDYAYARLVHIPDDANRKELLIIFMEDLAPTGWTGEDHYARVGINEGRIGPRSRPLILIGSSG